jgi:hypothetical protein
MKSFKLIFQLFLALLSLTGIVFIVQAYEKAKKDKSKTFSQHFKGVLGAFFNGKKTLTASTTPILPPVVPINQNPPTNLPKGEVPNFDIPPSNMWNYYRPDLFADFDMPMSYDPVMGRDMPNKMVIFHNYGYNMFGSAAKMFKKGFTMIKDDKIRQSDLPIEGWRVKIGGNDGLGGAGQDDTPENMYNWARNGALAACSALGLSKKENGKYDVALSMPDYEGVNTVGDDQHKTNILASGIAGQKSVVGNYTGNMYLNSIGGALGNIFSDMSQKKTFAWFNRADGNAVPEAQGTLFAEDPTGVQVVELDLHYETTLEHGQDVYDQNGNFWFKASFFGSEFSPNDSLNYPCNIPNFVAVVAGSIQEAYKNKAEGQLLIAQIKPNCQKGDGYLYNRDHAQYLDGKYIREYGRVTAILEGNIPSTTGQEVMTNFMVESMTPIAFFCGADGVNWWNSNHFPDLIPHEMNENYPRRGSKYDDPEYANINMSNYEYFMKSLSRMNTQIDTGNAKHSFYEVCNRKERYLNAETECSRDGGATFEKLTPVECQIQQKTAHYEIVNEELRTGFTLSLQSKGVEQDFIIARNQANGMQMEINVPPNTVVIRGYSW